MNALSLSHPVRLLVLAFVFSAALLLVASPARAAGTDEVIALPPELCDNELVSSTEEEVVCERGVLAPGLIKKLLASPYFTGATSPATGEVVVHGSNLDQPSSIMLGSLGSLGSPHYYDPAGPLAHLNPAGVSIIWTASSISIQDPWLSGQLLTNVAAYDSLGVKVGGYDFADVFVAPNVATITSPGDETVQITGAGLHLIDGVRVQTDTGEVISFGAAPLDDPTGTSVLVTHETTHYEVVHNADGSITITHPDLGGITISAVELTYQSTTVAYNGPGLKLGVLRKIEPATVTITGPVSGAILTHDPLVSFETLGEEVVTTCSVNGGAFATCSSPFAPLGLVDGKHAVTVEAMNRAGGEQETVTFALDLPAPAVSITSQPAAISSATSGSVEFTVDNPVGGDLETTCSIDAGAYVACASPLALSGLADGPHTVAVKAVGRGGTGDAQTLPFSVDTISPVLDASAAAAQAATEATAATGAAVSYPLPLTNEGTVSCSPASGSTFALGATTVNCEATDAAGNTGSTSFTVNVVDTTAPAIDVSAASAIGTVPATSGTGATVDYPQPTASDLVSGSVAVSCVPASGSTFEIGTTTVACQADDAALNRGSESFTVTVSPSTVVAATGAARISVQSPALLTSGNQLTARLTLSDGTTLNVASAAGDNSYNTASTACCGLTGARLWTWMYYSNPKVIATEDNRSIELLYPTLGRGGKTITRLEMFKGTDVTLEANRIIDHSMADAPLVVEPLPAWLNVDYLRGTGSNISYRAADVWTLELSQYYQAHPDRDMRDVTSMTLGFYDHGVNQDLKNQQVDLMAVGGPVSVLSRTAKSLIVQVDPAAFGMSAEGGPYSVNHLGYQIKGTSITIGSGFEPYQDLTTYNEADPFGRHNDSHAYISRPQDGGSVSVTGFKVDAAAGTMQVQGTLLRNLQSMGISSEDGNQVTKTMLGNTLIGQFFGLTNMNASSNYNSITLTSIDKPLYPNMTRPHGGIPSYLGSMDLVTIPGADNIQTVPAFIVPAADRVLVPAAAVVGDSYYQQYKGYVNTVTSPAVNTVRVEGYFRPYEAEEAFSTGAADGDGPSGVRLFMTDGTIVDMTNKNYDNAMTARVGTESFLFDPAAGVLEVKHPDFAGKTVAGVAFHTQTAPLTTATYGWAAGTSFTSQTTHDTFAVPVS